MGYDIEHPQFFEDILHYQLTSTSPLASYVWKLMKHESSGRCQG